MYQIAKYHDLCIHFYADDTQLYIGFNPLINVKITMEKIKNCLKDINHWMDINYLKLNIEKTDVIFIGKRNN